MQMSRTRNQWLDACRALAVTLVVLAHSLELFHKDGLARYQGVFGVMGVEIFFCLSGFLIGSIFIDVIQDFSGSPKTMLTFMARRWMRTLPNYYFYLALNLWMMWGGWLAVKNVDVTPYLFFTQNLLSPHPSFFPEAWSLAVEEVFYLLLPVTFFAAWLLIRKPIPALVTALATILTLSMTLRYSVALTDLDWDAYVRKITMLRLDSLMWGVLLAVMHWWLRARPTALRLSGWAMLCFLPLSLMGFTVGIPGVTDFQFRFLISTVTSIGICGALTLGMNLKLPGPVAETTGWLSKWSYSMYMANMPLYYFALHYLEFGQPFEYRLAEFVCYLALLWVMSMATYTFVERPFLALRDRYIPDTRGAAVPQRSTGAAASTSV